MKHSHIKNPVSNKSSLVPQKKRYILNMVFIKIIFHMKFPGQSTEKTEVYMFAVPVPERWDSQNKALKINNGNFSFIWCGKFSSILPNTLQFF